MRMHLITWLMKVFHHEKIYLVGNTSVDACLRAIEYFNQETLVDYSLEKEKLYTIHPSQTGKYYICRIKRDFNGFKYNFG